MPKKKVTGLGVSRSNESSSGFTCVVCQYPLAGGMFVSRWEDGNNDYSYVVCPHCRHKNIMEDGQD